MQGIFILFVFYLNAILEELYQISLDKSCNKLKKVKIALNKELKYQITKCLNWNCNILMPKPTILQHQPKPQ